MSTIKADNIATLAGVSTSMANAVNGSAKAWVNFNGTFSASTLYTVANGGIRSAYNVTSVTDIGVGQYTVNFSTAMANANYAIVGSASTDGVAYNGFVLSPGNVGRSTTSATINTLAGGSAGGTGYDPQVVNVAIFS